MLETYRSQVFVQYLYEHHATTKRGIGTKEKRNWGRTRWGAYCALSKCKHETVNHDVFSEKEKTESSGNRSLPGIEKATVRVSELWDRITPEAFQIASEDSS